MTNIASYQEGYTDGYDDARKKYGQLPKNETSKRQKMDNSQAVYALEHLYGFVSNEYQLALDLAIKALKGQQEISTKDVEKQHRS